MSKRFGLVTIGQTPRTDVVPELAEVLGPGVEIVERGALDGLDIRAVSALAPGPDDQVLVTRLRGGATVFVAAHRIAPRIQAALTDLDRPGVALSAILRTGFLPGLAAAAPLLHPDRVLLGVLRGLSWSGRLGVVAPSAAHVPQTADRWRAYGFDAVVTMHSPFDEAYPGALTSAAEA